MFTIAGSKQQAADAQMQLGGVYRDMGNSALAISSWTKAGELYAGNEQAGWFSALFTKSKSPDAFYQAAITAVAIQDYAQAIQLFAKLPSSYSGLSGQPQEKFKKHLNLILCHILLRDIGSAESLLSGYHKSNAGFTVSPQGKLLQGVVVGVKGENEKILDGAIATYMKEQGGVDQRIMDLLMKIRGGIGLPEYSALQ